MFLENIYVQKYVACRTIRNKEGLLPVEMAKEGRDITDGLEYALTHIGDKRIECGDNNEDKSDFKLTRETLETFAA